jgi:hypothetical protein
MMSQQQVFKMLAAFVVHCCVTTDEEANWGLPKSLIEG